MDFEEEADQTPPRSAPVSPIGYYFNSSLLSISIIAVLEFKVPIDDLPVLSLVKHVFLPINPRFSSIMITDTKGLRRWRKVEVKLEDHVKVPVFLPKMASSDHLFDDCFSAYLSDVAAEQFDQSKPLWEIHKVKYPTSSAAGNLVFKLHHSLGDGFSLMGALLSTLQRSDDPSLPLTFPTARKPNPLRKSGGFKYISNILLSVYNGLKDFCWSNLMSTVVEDDLTPIRSKNCQHNLISISTVAFSLDAVKHIKNSLPSTTINDVITGTIFLGCRLYMRSMGEVKYKSRSTALVLLNMRAFTSYESVMEMMKPNTKSPWGNRNAFLHITIPMSSDSNFSNPLEFVFKAQKTIRRKRSSVGVYLTGCLLGFIHKVKGPEAVTKYLHGTLKNSSMGITNLIGPIEEMALENHPVKGCYFVAVGGPQSIMTAIMSYMGTLTVAIAAEKGFVDVHKFSTCIESAFDMILKAAGTPSHSN